jgi:hypothetical protein
MRTFHQALSAAGVLLIPLTATHAASAQKNGGILKISFFDNPASMSLHEELPPPRNQIAGPCSVSRLSNPASGVGFQQWQRLLLTLAIAVQ